MNKLIDKILSESGFKSNPYFVALREKTFSKEDFVETQIQFFSAVAFFNRPMTALAAKIPTAELRLEILRNVWEEHGEGIASQTHEKTFSTFLNRVAGITPDQIEKRALWSEVRIFNTTLIGACVLDEYLIGVGMMGMIERMFCEISNWIGNGVIANKWLTEDQLIHYNMHEKLDIKHSDDFFDVLRPAWEQSEENKYYIEQGLRLGATLFNGLYDGLYKSRNKRLMRNVLGPHSRAE